MDQSNIKNSMPSADRLRDASRLDGVPAAPVTFVRRPKPFDRDAAMRAYEKEHPEALQSRMHALKVRHAGTHLRVFADNPRRFFEDGFREILSTRMAGLPILNPKLVVSATDFVRIGIDDAQAWIGVVVTPWAVMAVLAPARREGWRFIAAGGFEEIELAAGDFRFVACADSILGHYRSLSLKSPVFEFQDMASARAFADACLNLLLGRQQLQEEPEAQNPTLSPDRETPQEAQEPMPETLSRRGLFGRYTQALTSEAREHRDDGGTPASVSSETDAAFHGEKS